MGSKLKCILVEKNSHFKYLLIFCRFTTARYTNRFLPEIAHKFHQLNQKRTTDFSSD